MALAGFLAGPLLHALGVQSGTDLPLRPLEFPCPRCPGTGWAIRCSCGRSRLRELATGVIAALGAGFVAAAIGWTPVLAAHMALVAVTTILIVTDLDHLRIPNRILYPGGFACLVLLTAGALASGRGSDLIRGLGAGVAYWGLFLVVWLTARGQGFGFGDVRLAALLGLFLGFHSWRVLIWGLFATALLGGVPAIIFLMRGKSRTTLLPYGPPLIVGTWVALALAGRI